MLRLVTCGEHVDAESRHRDVQARGHRLVPSRPESGVRKFGAEFELRAPSLTPKVAPRHFSAFRSETRARKVKEARSAGRACREQTLVCLISGLGTGEGISWRDAMRAAGSLFTSPGISILLEVIASVSPLVGLPACRASGAFFNRFAIRTLRVPSWVYNQVSAAVRFHWAEGRAVLWKLNSRIYINGLSRAGASRRRNASTPPTSLALPVLSPTADGFLRNQQKASVTVDHGYSTDWRLYWRY